MKQNILVVGATGTVGTEIVKGLKAEGHNVRSATSKSGNIPADQVHLNLQTGGGRSEAFKNIDRVFLLSP
ncbi:MAG TPA: NAD-dependent epimerase/dehydratase family protein, partial [Bdellovibrio sp.]